MVLPVFVLRRLRVGLLSMVMVCAVVASTQAEPAPTFQPNQAVAVEMDGTWQPATFLQRQNQFVQVRFPDGREEWLAAARVRPPDATAAEGGGTASPDAASPPPKPAEDSPASAPVPSPKSAEFRVGQKVECKWGHRWEEVTLRNRRSSGWYLVQHPGQGEWMEWVEPWRLRAIGSTEDPIGFVHRNKLHNDPVKNPPPTPEPGPPPEPPSRSVPARPEQRPTAPATPTPSRPKQITEDPAAVRETDFQNDPAYKDPDYSRVLDLSSLRAQTRRQSRDATDFSPDPPPPVTLPRGEVRVLTLSHGGTHFNFPIASVQLTRDDPRRVLVELQPFNNKALRPRIERLDVTERKSIDVTPIPLETRLMAASPDGLRFAISQLSNVEQDRIEVWDWPLGGPAVRALVFYPYRKTGERTRTRQTIGHVSFLDRETLVTIGGGSADTPNQLVVWDIATAQAKWSVPQKFSDTPVFSPGGKQIAIHQHADHAVRVFDLARGAVVATLKEEAWVNAPCMSFTANGDRLFTTGSSADCDVYDLATGTRVSRVNSSGLYGDAYPLVDGYVATHFGTGFVMTHAELATKVWRYMPEAGLRDFKLTPGGIVVYGTNEGSVCIGAVPQPRALEMAAPLSPETALALRPGVAVSIELNLDATDAEKAAVEAALREELAEGGLTVQPRQPLRIVATTGVGQPEQKEFRAEVLMSPTGAVAVGENGFAQVTPRYCKLEVIFNGATLWVQGDQWNAASIRNRPGLDLQAAVDADARYPFEFYSTVDIPERIAAPRDLVPDTTFTATGMGF